MKYEMNEISISLHAFLTMISVSEGTSTCPHTQDDGYDILVGGTRFEGYTDHPRILVDLGHGLKSTAAGRYQILERFYDAYKTQLNLPDFGHDSQDAIALQMMREHYAVESVNAGNLALAVHQCRNIWASFPDSPYGQHAQKYNDLQQAYINAGGTLSST